MTTPQLSVILPVRDGEPFVAGMLESLATQVTTFDWEMIVVDNGSTDGTLATARSFEGRLPALRVLSEARAGKSNALNAGIAAAAGSYLVFVDADDQVAPGYLQAMADGLDTYEMVSGRMDTTVLNPGWAQGVKLREDGLTNFLDWHVMVGGGLLGIRADVRKRVGDFDPELRCGEDVDFTWRAALQGIDTGFVPDAVLYVRRPLTVREAFAKGRAYGRSHTDLFVRFRDEGQPRRSWRNISRHGYATVSVLFRPGEHRWWYFALEGGTIWGRAEQSVRRRVFYP